MHQLLNFASKPQIRVGFLPEKPLAHSQPPITYNFHSTTRNSSVREIDFCGFPTHLLSQLVNLSSPTPGCRLRRIRFDSSVRGEKPSQHKQTRNRTCRIFDPEPAKMNERYDQGRLCFFVPCFSTSGRAVRISCFRLLSARLRTLPLTTGGGNEVN